MIIAVDFDGTLCECAWPDIGKPITPMIKLMKFAREIMGHKLILWTCREGKALNAAVDWCSNLGLDFDYVNESLPEMIEKYGKSRKVGADVYIDDKAANGIAAAREAIWHEST